MRKMPPDIGRYCPLSAWDNMAIALSWRATRSAAIGCTQPLENDWPGKVYSLLMQLAHFGSGTDILGQLVASRPEVEI